MHKWGWIRTSQDIIRELKGERGGHLCSHVFFFMHSGEIRRSEKMLFVCLGARFYVSGGVLIGGAYSHWQVARSDFNGGGIHSLLCRPFSFSLYLVVERSERAS